MRRILLILFISVLPSVAYAACDPADMAGTYQVYALSVESQPDLATCTVKVLSSGFLKKKTACQDTLADGDLDDNLFVERGKLSVNSQCRVKGFVVIGSAEGTERNDVVHATLSEDGSTLVGILTNPNNEITQFTGVRK